MIKKIVKSDMNEDINSFSSTDLNPGRQIDTYTEHLFFVENQTAFSFPKSPTEVIRQAEQIHLICKAVSSSYFAALLNWFEIRHSFFPHGDIFPGTGPIAKQ